MAVSSDARAAADALRCRLCEQVFDRERMPVSLCEGAVCSSCIAQPSLEASKRRLLPVDAGSRPINRALLHLLGVSMTDCTAATLSSVCTRASDASCATHLERTLLELSAYVKCTRLDDGSPALVSDCLLGRRTQRRLLAVISAPLDTSEGRRRARDAARALVVRILSEVLLRVHSQAHMSSLLWSAVRSRGAQFLGSPMQDRVLCLILAALAGGELVARKTLVYSIVTALQDEHLVSKTSVGHVVQLLYRASCFVVRDRLGGNRMQYCLQVLKRDGESSLMQLKEEYRDYARLRREHDTQIVQIALEAGLHISADAFSFLLYGDSSHRECMEGILDAVEASPQSVNQSVGELRALVARNDDSTLIILLDEMQAVLLADENEANTSLTTINDTYTRLLNILRAYNIFSKTQCSTDGRAAGKMERVAASSTRRAFKTRLCRAVALGRACTRGDRCTYAHSDDELRNIKGRFVDELPPPHLLFAASSLPLPQLLSGASTANVLEPAPLLRSVPMMAPPLLIPQVPPPPPLLFPQPAPLSTVLTHLDTYAAPLNKGASIFVPVQPLPPAPTNCYLPSAAAAPHLLLCPAESTTAYAPLFYPRVEEVVPHRSDEGATYELQPTGKLSTWLSPTEDDQHLLLRRHEIVTRLAQMRFEPMPRGDDAEDDLTSHVSYTVAASVLFDELETTPRTTSIELPPLPSISSLPLATPSPRGGTGSDSSNGAYTAVGANVLGTPRTAYAPSTLEAVSTLAPATSAAAETQLANAARLSRDICSAYPAVLHAGSTTSPAMVQADCSRMLTTDTLAQSLMISSVQQHSLMPPLATMASVTPINFINELPRTYVPLTLEDHSPRALVARSLDRIIDVKERIRCQEVNHNGHVGAAVQRAQLNVELTIATMNLHKLDKQTKHSCLQKELQAVDRALEENRTCTVYDDHQSPV